MIKFFLLLCSLEAEEVATHGAPEAWKEARERVDKTFQVFFHTFVSPAQYILYLIQLNCTKVNDDVNDEYEDNGDDDNDGARLGICQKIYTTQFSGARILHTENA